MGIKFRKILDGSFKKFFLKQKTTTPENSRSRTTVLPGRLTSLMLEIERDPVWSGKCGRSGSYT